MLGAARIANWRAFDAAMTRLRERDYQAVIAAGKDSRVPMSRIVAAGMRASPAAAAGRYRVGDGWRA